METQHTPGPWFVTRGNEIGHDYTDNAGNRHVGYIAETLHRGEQGRANARLIAAAPELLAACRAVLDGRDPAWGMATSNLAIEKCRAAIAKAEGSK